MSNVLKFGNKVVFANGNAITLASSASDPSSPSAGDLYFNSVSNKVRFYNGSAWADIDSNTLTGISLSAQNIIVGNGSNISAAVDSSAVGDILADSTNGLTIKSGVIVNADVNASAAIAYSKLNLANSVKASDVDSEASTNGYVLTSDGAGGAAWGAAASGTVTSVALTVPNFLSVSGSPVTTSGTLAVSLATQVANTVFAGPSNGVDAAPTFRTLVAADIPSLAYANQALSNLSSVAINSDLLPGADDTIDLGSSALAYTDLFVKNVDSPNADLTIKSSAANGNVIVQANGTGNLNIQAAVVKQSESAASSNFKEEQYFDALALAANTSAFTAISSLTFAHASFTGAILEYSIKEATSNAQRIGRLIVATDGTTSSSSDQYSETAQLGNATGLILQAAVNGANVEIQFNNTHATNACTMRVSVTRFRA